MKGAAGYPAGTVEKRFVPGSALRNATCLTVILSVLTWGCATRSTDISSDQMVGIVYAEDGRPVAGAEIRVDQYRRGISDAFGRFRVTGVPAGRRVVYVTAEGYESAQREFHFENRTQLVRVDLVGYAALVDRFLRALEDGHHRKAREIAGRIEAVDPRDPRTMLVRQVLQSRDPEGGSP